MVFEAGFRFRPDVEAHQRPIADLQEFVVEPLGSVQRCLEEENAKVRAFVIPKKIEESVSHPPRASHRGYLTPEVPAMFAPCEPSAHGMGSAHSCPFGCFKSLLAYRTFLVCKIHTLFVFRTIHSKTCYPKGFFPLESSCTSVPF